MRQALDAKDLGRWAELLHKRVEHLPYETHPIIRMLRAISHTHAWHTSVTTATALIYIAIHTYLLVCYTGKTTLATTQRLRKHVTTTHAGTEDSSFHDLLRNTTELHQTLVPVELVDSQQLACYRERSWWHKVEKWAVNDTAPALPSDTSQRSSIQQIVNRMVRHTQRSSWERQAIRARIRVIPSSPLNVRRAFERFANKHDKSNARPTCFCNTQHLSIWRQGGTVCQVDGRYALLPVSIEHDGAPVHATDPLPCSGMRSREHAMSSLAQLARTLHIQHAFPSHILSQYLPEIEWQTPATLRHRIQNIAHSLSSVACIRVADKSSTMMFAFCRQWVWDQTAQFLLSEKYDPQPLTDNTRISAVAKPGSTAKRLVVDYGELNKKTLNHSGSIPNMESTLEKIASCRYKTKMDKRSGFWQVDLTPNAQELLAFITPQARVFKWKVMPFGVANAPALFQELMNKILSILRRRPKVQELISRGAQMEAHIDDVCLGTNTQEDHLILLGEFFAVCQENHTRLKLEKCEFMQETMQYLGFDVGYGWWTPAASKAKPLMDAKVRHEDPKKGLHDVRSFIGACNFYRRHIKNFTYTSAVLTDLIKKSTTWRWGPQEQQAFDELKDKVANAKCLGVPRAQGEIILVTDASNVGGGGTLFQWQALEKEEFDSAISQWGTEGLN